MNNFGYLADSLEKHEIIEEGYNRIYKGFDLIAARYKRADDEEHFELYKDIAERFKKVHETCLNNVRAMRMKYAKFGGR